jgi:DNA polymerase-3 subunit beta
MKFNTQAQTFQKSITFISKFVEDNSHIPILDCIKLYANPNSGRILSVGSDLEFWGSDSVEGDIEGGGKICVPSDKLKKVLSNINGEVRVELDGNQLKIESEYGDYNLVTQSAEEYPDFPSVPDKTGVSLPDLSEIWKKSKWSIGSEQKDFVHIGENGGDLTFTTMSETGITRSQYPVESDFDEIDAYIPSKFFKRLSKHSDKNVNCISSENSITFRLENSLCNARLVANNSHNFDKYIPNNQPNSVQFNRKDLIDRLKPLSAFADFIDFEVNNEVEIKASSNETGEGSSYILPEEVLGERGLKFTLNIAYTIDVLKSLDGDSVKFEYGNGKSVKIEESNFTFVLLTL